MRTMRFKKLIVGVSILAAPAFAMAQSAEQLVQKYTPLVGSETNAQALVTGLRDGTEVVMLMQVTVIPTLSVLPLFGPPPPPPPPVVTTVEVKFTPRTGQMGFGNVDNALTLTQGTLKNINIVAGTPGAYERNATPEDVKAALMGGVVKTPRDTLMTLPGILELRYFGNGWGEIAKQVGAKL